ncbi:O-antigen ligase family protein [Flavobacteriales bacterium]|nr:O-antigen ligase family protein [Flavobacteriales bacterium]
MLEKGKLLISYITGYWTHLFCLSLIVIGMPFSKFLMSLGTICLIVNWFLEGGVVSKFKSFFNNKVALYSTGVFIVFFLGLIHTQDFAYGLKDLRIKLPLLAFPVIFSTTHRLKKSHYFLIVRLFVLSVLASSLYGFLVYQDLLPAKKEVNQIRDISQFISHIRLSMMIVLSLFLIPKLFNKNTSQKVFGVVTSLWFLYFLSFMESATGLILGFVTLFFISLYYLFRKKSIYGFAMIAPIIIIGFILGQNLLTTYSNLKIDVSNKEIVTKSGNAYDTESVYYFFDNGNYSNDYMCEKELESTWNTVSTTPYYAEEGEYGTKYILIRYLTSKGLRKDKEGVLALSNTDIKNIENKIPNYLHANSTMVSRIHLLMFEIDGYFKGVNSSGNSLAQRLQYWKLSKAMIQESPFIGYGTGDVPLEFEKQYEANKKCLEKMYQLRSHNQYLSTTIALGIIGLVFFLFFVLYPVPKAFRERNYFYLICLCIALLSFISEDTLETQDGVFFFAFLTNFFLFSSKNRYLKSVD